VTRPTCTRCRQVHTHCTAHNRAGRPCGQPPQPFQDVCHLHGGRSPRAVAAAENRRQQHEAAEVMRTLGRPVDTTPTEALLEEVKWTAGHVAWLRERVQELEQDQVVWGRTQEVEKGSGEFPGTDTTKAAAPNVWLDLYDRERKHLVQVCSAALKAGIEERRVRLAEQQGQLVALVIRQILEDLQLTPEQQQLVPTVVPARLRAIEGGAA